jgi:hypothetical protein
MRTLLTVMIALCACKPRQVEYKMQEFPGFSVEVPESMSAGADAKYRQGEAHVELGAKVVMVSWQLGAIASSEELPQLMKSMGALFPKLGHIEPGAGRATKIGGQAAIELDANVEGASVYFADVTCGRRSVQFCIAGASDVEDMRRRVVPSFQCHPIAAEEQALANGAPIGVDDPSVLKGWSRMANDDAFTIGDGHAILTFSDVPLNAEDIAPGAMRRLIPQLFKAFGGKWESGRTEIRTVGGQQREFQLGTMTTDANKLPGAITLWPCPDDGGAVMALALMIDDSPIASSIDLITKLRCPKPGDPPLPLAEPAAAPPEVPKPSQGSKVRATP